MSVDLHSTPIFVADEIVSYAINRFTPYCRLIFVPKGKEHLRRLINSAYDQGLYTCWAPQALECSRNYMDVRIDIGIRTYRDRAPHIDT